MRNSDQLKAPARRTFAKSLAATFLAAPLALAQREKTEKCPECDDEAFLTCCHKCHQTTAEGPLMPTPCPRIDLLGAEPHEPPIIISGGSLQMECEKKIEREGPVLNPTRNHRYEFADYLYGAMVSLQVITEYNNVFTSDCYVLDGAVLPGGVDVVEPRFHIWLQRQRSFQEEPPKVFWHEEDIDPAKDSHLLFTYSPHTFSISPEIQLPAMVLETDKKFHGPKKSFRETLNYKHRHKGYGDRHFRIGRWRLVNRDGPLIAGNSARVINAHTEILGFQLIPRFEHTGRRLKRELDRLRQNPPR